jgi:hypothetical protein
MASHVGRLSVALWCLTLCSCGRAEQPPASQQVPAAQQPEPAAAAGWLQHVPDKNPDELTFDDFKNAFDAQYRHNPAPLEEVTPVSAAGPKDPARKRASEEDNLFRRWEWFTRPRVYPTGRWDNQKVLTELQRVAAADNE